MFFGWFGITFIIYIFLKNFPEMVLNGLKSAHTWNWVFARGAAIGYFQGGGRGWQFF